MAEFEEIIEDRPDALQEQSDRGTYPFDFSGDGRGIGAAIGIALVLLPIGLMVGAMRWNIAGTLDADLEWILTKFCDTVLLFCIALPLCPLLPGEWGNKLSRRVFKGLWRLLMVAKWIGILVFSAAGLASVGYVCWMVWKMISG